MTWTPLGAVASDNRRMLNRMLLRMAEYDYDIGLNQIDFLDGQFDTFLDADKVDTLNEIESFFGPSPPFDDDGYIRIAGERLDVNLIDTKQGSTSSATSDSIYGIVADPRRDKNYIFAVDLNGYIYKYDAETLDLVSDASIDSELHAIVTGGENLFVANFDTNNINLTMVNPDNIDENRSASFNAGYNTFSEIAANHKWVIAGTAEKGYNYREHTGNYSDGWVNSTQNTNIADDADIDYSSGYTAMGMVDIEEYEDYVWYGIYDLALGYDQALGKYDLSEESVVTQTTDPEQSRPNPIHMMEYQGKLRGFVGEQDGGELIEFNPDNMNQVDIMYDIGGYEEKVKAIDDNGESLVALVDANYVRGIRLTDDGHIDGFPSYEANGDDYQTLAVTQKHTYSKELNSNRTIEKRGEAAIGSLIGTVTYKTINLDFTPESAVLVYEFRNDPPADHEIRFIIEDGSGNQQTITENDKPVEISGFADGDITISVEIERKQETDVSAWLDEWAIYFDGK